MTHFSKKVWRNYTLDLLSDTERESVEQHLYECDHCLTLYMEIIEEQNENLPMMNEDSFTDTVMKQITFEKVESEELTSKKQPNRIKSTLIHYIIATAATVIFMASGLFHYLFSMTSSFEHSSKQSEMSISKQILEKNIYNSKKMDSKTNGGLKRE
ncbi:hypothetical protein [Bacillus gaemokensis]|uniref:Zinc-finger domain-containing protein n=1 Tax=Bacillus gaemokensis TaxID=574375 RepID=A0A073KBJ3_9BACI|nr:hypothetical protein [Bacillus gaemokensis]KEK24644.1 hypothetical protein BAGA_23515 [Bacillus gaemokensis]KYG34466.1 hypothetical protein AZF08_08670 [Bacillus gaemokensis]